MTEKPVKPLSERIAALETQLIWMTPEGTTRPHVSVDVAMIRQIVSFLAELAEMMEKK